MSSRSLAKEHQHGTGEKLGAVHFATSCNGAAQRDIDRAVALLHSFDFSRAIDDFNVALGTDATCTIAYWGIALSDWGNPFAPGNIDKRLLQLGRESAERGEMLGAKTARERAYLAAVSNLYRDFEGTPQQARLLAYRNAMEVVAAKYPEDHEATDFLRIGARRRRRSRGQDLRRPAQGGGNSSRNCSRRSRRIPDWHTTLSMPTTCPRWRGDHLSRRADMRRLLPTHLMRCTCHPIHLPAWEIGKRRFRATWPLRRRHGGRVRRQKSYMPATTRPTLTCKQGRMRQRDE